MGIFRKKINGKTREFIHNSRHKANSRSVNLVKYLEHLRGVGAEDTQEIINAFKTGYNMGYTESKKRSRKLNQIKK